MDYKIDFLSWVDREYVQPHHLPLARSTWRCPWRWAEHMGMPCSYNIDLEGRFAVQAYVRRRVTEGTMLISLELMRDFKASVDETIRQHAAEHRRDNFDTSDEAISIDSDDGTGIGVQALSRENLAPTANCPTCGCSNPRGHNIHGRRTRTS
ncbi:hypothetical protein C8J57DRAFT_1356895 [Mycena rebaudengoi]|nr:hypothetical protein C8J57DRAFT_1356895 [Mycena rebaudengoi]